MFKKKIKAVPVLDLRNYTPKALSKIKSISAVALLLLPEKPSAEFMNEFSRIDVKAVALTVNAAPEKRIVTLNGANIVSGVEAENSICLCNGMTFVHSVNKSHNVEFVFNGIVIKQLGSEIKSLAANGRVVEWDFDSSKIKMHTGSLDVDLQFINNCEEGTVIGAVGSVSIGDDVKQEDIISRNIRFVAIDKVICGKDIYGCVAGRTVVVNKIEVKE